MTAGQKKPPSRHTSVELSSVSIKRMESALEKAKLVLCEWQISHSKWAEDWEEPDQHYLALSGILDALDELRKLEKQLFAKQRSRRSRANNERNQKRRRSDPEAQFLSGEDAAAQGAAASSAAGDESPGEVVARHDAPGLESAADRARLGWRSLQARRGVVRGSGIRFARI